MNETFESSVFEGTLECESLGLLLLLLLSFYQLIPGGKAEALHSTVSFRTS